MEGPARDALIAAHAEWARNVALTVLRRRRLHLSPDDAVGAALLALVEVAGRYVPRAADEFTTFAYKRVAGAVLDLSYEAGVAIGRTADGKRQFRPADADVDRLAWRLRDPAPGPGELAEAAEVLRWAERLFDELPPREGQALRLVYVEGLRLVDAGKALGCSEGRACQLAKAGIAKIRARLGVE